MVPRPHSFSRSDSQSSRAGSGSLSAFPGPFIPSSSPRWWLRYNAGTGVDDEEGTILSEKDDEAEDDDDDGGGRSGPRPFCRWCSSENTPAPCPRKKKWGSAALRYISGREAVGEGKKKGGTQEKVRSLAQSPVVPMHIYTAIYIYPFCACICPRPSRKKRSGYSVFVRSPEMLG